MAAPGGADAITVTYAAHASLQTSPLLPHFISLLSAQLHLKAGAMGLLLSAFLWTYALAQAPVGALIDRLGPRRLLAAAMVLW